MAGLNDIVKLIRPLHNRVMNMIARALIEKIDPSTEIQLARVDLGNGEIRDGLEVIEHYGFTSVPENGDEAVIVFLGGNRDDGLVIATSAGSSRPRGDAGDTIVYNKTGSTITLKANGDVEINSVGKVDINNGNLTVES